MKYRLGHILWKENLCRAYQRSRETIARDLNKDQVDNDKEKENGKEII